MPPASRGGLLLAFTKKNGLSQRNYIVVIASTAAVCVRWDTGTDLLGPQLPAATWMPALGWTTGTDHV